MWIDVYFKVQALTMLQMHSLHPWAARPSHCDKLSRYAFGMVFFVELNNVSLATPMRDCG
jgi:hypothetical protein